MYEKFITNTCNWFRKSNSRMKLIKILHDILPIIMYITYPLLIISLAIYKDEFLLRALIVPATVFCGITIMRMIINAKRPYEVYAFDPLVNKKTKGKSFPSRHTASAFIIALTFLKYETNLGILMLVIAVMIALVRIITGVHFVRDVITGAVISTVIGVVFYFII